MADINPRIMETIWESKYDKSIKQFLIDVIREEMIRADQFQWHYGEVYDKLVEKYALKSDEE